MAKQAVCSSQAQETPFGFLLHPTALSPTWGQVLSCPGPGGALAGAVQGYLQWGGGKRAINVQINSLAPLCTGRCAQSPPLYQGLQMPEFAAWGWGGEASCSPLAELAGPALCQAGHESVGLLQSWQLLGSALVLCRCSSRQLPESLPRRWDFASRLVRRDRQARYPSR